MLVEEIFIVATVRLQTAAFTSVCKCRKKWFMEKKHDPSSENVWITISWGDTETVLEKHNYPEIQTILSNFICWIDCKSWLGKA